MFFEKKHKYLLDLNMDILGALLKLLKCERTVGMTFSYEQDPTGISDHRGIFGGKQPSWDPAYPPYTQVFSSRQGFIPGLSILDVIFNLGPETLSYLEKTG